MNWKLWGHDALVFLAIMVALALIVVAAKHVADWWPW